jgi:chaperonin GroEL (HSP60 family)
MESAPHVIWISMCTAMKRRFFLCVQAIIKAFRTAGQLAVEHVRKAATSIAVKDPEETKQLLQKCASTTLNSKLVRTQTAPA